MQAVTALDDDDDAEAGWAVVEADGLDEEPLDGGLDGGGSPATVTLESSEGEAVEVGREDASLVSQLVRSTLENDAEADRIPLPGVEARVLRLVKLYIDHHRGTEPAPPRSPLLHARMMEVCEDPWDAHFIDRVGASPRLLMDLMLAANYLGMDGLMRLGAAKIASLTRGEPLDTLELRLSGRPAPADAGPGAA